MEFCPNCGSSLSRKNKCTCNISNDDFTSTENTTNKIINPSFPFEKEKYYEQGFIRKCIGHPQWGISYNKEGYWVIIKNKKSGTNTYYDRMDKDGFYRYTGQGLSGDQTYDNANNYGLKNAKSKGQKMHLFWQDNQNSKHKYIGEVKIVKIKDDEEQNGADGYPRKAIVFTLQPTE